MDKGALIRLVERMQSGEDDEGEINMLIDLFLANATDPNATDFLFAKEHEGLSAEEIVSKALAYMPIKL
jgi:hypothetical protein